MDFLFLASISMPAIHSKTSAKVIKRNETGKKIINFLANPKEFSSKEGHKRISSISPDISQPNL